jgi:hypothetical protein
MRRASLYKDEKLKKTQVTFFFNLFSDLTLYQKLILP